MAALEAEVVDTELLLTERVADLECALDALCTRAWGQTYAELLTEAKKGPNAPRGLKDLCPTCGKTKQMAKANNSSCRDYFHL